MKLKAIIESGIIENIEDTDIFTIDMTRIPIARGLDYDITKIYSHNDTTCIVTSKTKEEDDKEVTDNKMMEYAIAIKNHCNGRRCKNCIFHIGTLCHLNIHLPFEWKIEEESK